jgi:peptide/nickel transport system ATP-binding protein
MSQPLLQVSHLSIRLNAQPVVSDISFSIAPSSIVGLFGESGCGKTTLALSLLKLLPRQYDVQGQVRLDGADLLPLPERKWQPIRGARIAMIPQDPLLALNPVLRVCDQVDEVRRAHPARAIDLNQLFQLTGLPESRRRAYPHQLSGGERQRVLLAQALACRPALVIADEPFTALDATRVLELSALFARLKETLGVGFLLISHSPGILARIAGELLVMYAGRIVERGAPAQLLRDPLHPYTAGLLRSLRPQPDRRLYSIPGNPPALTGRAAGCPFEPRCEIRIDRCLAEMPPEEIPADGRTIRCFKYVG